MCLAHSGVVTQISEAVAPLLRKELPVRGLTVLESCQGTRSLTKSGDMFFCESTSSPEDERVLMVPIWVGTQGNHPY